MKKFNLLKDWKFLIGIFFVVMSFVLGLVGKVAFFSNIKSESRWNGIAIYLFSWVLVFMGGFLIGKEVVIAARMKIEDRVKHHSKKGIEKISKLRRGLIGR